MKYITPLIAAIIILVVLFIVFRPSKGDKPVPVVETTHPAPDTKPWKE